MYPDGLLCQGYLFTFGLEPNVFWKYSSTALDSPPKVSIAYSSSIIIPPFLYAFFGLFVGTVQAFVFTMLTIVYISVQVR